MNVVFVDDADNVATTPNALHTVSPSNGPTADETKDFQNVEGMMAVFRALRHIKLHVGDTKFLEIAATARDQYADETEENLTDDLLADFAD